MTVKVLGQGQIEHHKDYRPYDRVETYNFLSGHVHICGPVFFKIIVLFVAVAERTDIV